MPNFHVKGWISYTFRKDDEADIDTVVEADSQEEAEEIALKEWEDDRDIFAESDIEIEQTSLTVTCEDDDESTYPAWKEMEKVGAPSLFEYARARV